MYIRSQDGDLFFKEMKHYYLYITSDGDFYHIMLHESTLRKKSAIHPEFDTTLASYKFNDDAKTVFNYLRIAAANFEKYIVELPKDHVKAIDSWCNNIEAEIANYSYPVKIIKS